MPIVLAHSGDLHITAGPRLATTQRVLEWMVDDADQAGVDLWSLAGDFFGTTVPHRGTPEEKLVLAQLLRRMSRVFVERGNHESPLDFDLFPLLMGSVTYAAMPRLSSYKTLGIVQAPYPWKHAWVGADVPASIAEQNALASERYLTVVRQLVEEARAQFKVVILLGHFNVVGALTGGGEILSGHEVEFTVAQLSSLPVDLILLSHIHKCQEMAPGIWYAGSPSAQNFGEATDRKCYLLATITGTKVAVTKRYTPAPTLWTLEASYQLGGVWEVAWPLVDADFLRGSECRLIASVPEECRAGVTTHALEGTLRERGVAHVQVELRIVPQSTIRSAAIVRAETPAEKLVAWSAVQDPPIDAERLARMQTLLTEFGDAASS